ncbi:hypothetical protein GZH53_03295 [Flavihumibacter sp. R14]|nr:hypothetical protein [Flavihumibacter soli]
MEPMQDKDFDQLFKQRFEAFEVEPSGRSWDNITGQLDGQRKKGKAFPSFWMAAASLVIMTSAVLLLYRPAEVIKLRGKADSQVAVNQKPAVNELEPLSSETVDRAEDLRNPVDPIRRERVSVSEKQVHKSMNGPEQNAAVISEKAEMVQGDVLIANQPLTVSEMPEAEIKTEESEPILAQNVSDTDDAEPAGPARQKIKSVGGLVNFVIARVDKRDNKIIEFRDGEEGTEVSGINLGPIRFKSRNK